MKLVSDARHWWRWFSVQAMVLATALQGAWVYLPDDLRDTAPDWAVHAVTMGILALGFIGRLVDQGGGDV